MKIRTLFDSAARFLVDPENIKNKNSHLAWAAAIVLGTLMLGIPQILSGVWRTFRPEEENATHKRIRELFSNQVKKEEKPEEQVPKCGHKDHNLEGKEQHERRRSESGRAINPQTADSSPVKLLAPDSIPIVKEPMEELIETLVFLSDLSHVLPHKEVHFDRTGRIIHTASEFNWFPGVQTITKLAKRHKDEKFSKELQNYLDKFTSTIDLAISSGDCFSLLFIQEKITLALGKEKPLTGLKALQKTYQRKLPIIGVVNSLVDLFEEKKEAIQKAIEENANPESYSENFKTLWKGYSHQLRSETIRILNPKFLFNYSLALAFSHVNCLVGDWNWQDKIGDYEGGTLYLGVLSTISPWQNSLNWMKEEGITDVLSVVEPFENISKGLLIKPIPPKKLQKEGINQFQLEAEDFETLSQQQIERGVEYLNDALSKGGKVYVHCKAGRSRSALVVMCYLVKYQKMTAQEALAHVRAQRKQAGFKENKSKWNSLIEYEKKWA